MEKMVLLTTKQVAEMCQVKARTVTQKFVKKEGLPVIKIGKRDYRFDPRDVKNFLELRKQIVPRKLEIIPLKSKVKNKRLNIDFEKRRINIELNKVV